MAANKYSDLHCHPSMQPLMLSKSTLWDTLGKKPLKRIIRHQKKGKRGGLYDQSGYPKLVNGEVKLIYAAVYSLEQGFMMNNNPLLGFFNVILNGGPLALFGLKIFGKNGHLRDFFMSLFTKFPKKKLKHLKGREYWDELLGEFEMYRKEHLELGTISDKNQKEIKAMLKHAYNSDSGFRPRGTFRVADSTWTGQLPTDEVLTVMTIEGLANLSQTKVGASDSKHGTLSLSEQTIWHRITYLKEQLPVFFVTFSHHFSSELCGHARSFPDKARKLGILNQEYFINQGFSRFGYRVLQYLLGVHQQNGKWVKDTNAKRRILIDVKHMSLKGRLSLYQLIQDYNSNGQNPDKIPIVASHVGYSNRSIGQMLYNINTERENSKTQSEVVSINGREHYFNTWSINLGMEEIGIIVKSGGLIGVSMEQNNLGIPFGKKMKNKGNEFFVDLIFNQVMAMARAAGLPEFWNCITMGTDYDGLIDPVDRYSSALFFEQVRKDIKTRFSRLRPDELIGAHLPNPLNDTDLEKLLDKFFFENAYRFLKTHFDVGTIKFKP